MPPSRPACIARLPPRWAAAYKARVLHAAWALASVLALAAGEPGPAASSLGAAAGWAVAQAVAPNEPSTPPSSSSSSPGSGTASSDPESKPKPQADAGADAAGTGRLVFGPEARGALTVVDARGRVVASVVLRGSGRTMVELPPGRYSLRDPEGHEVSAVELEADQVRAVTLPDSEVADAPPPKPDDAPPPPAVVTGRLDPDALDPASEVELVRRRRWARWAAPLLSAVVPGGGQALNGQPGRGLAVFTGTVGLVLGTIAVAAARNPTAGADPSEGGGGAREVVRLGALGGLGAAAGLLYVGQILDAHAQAVDRRAPDPRRGHVVALEVSRSSTVGFSPGQPSVDLYSDWSLAVMGQLVPRVTLGVSDLSIKLGRPDGRVTVQAGARAAYRFFERGRVWLGAGGGVLLQGTRANAALVPLTEGAGPSGEAQRAISVVPYAHFDARLFLLDRWSLGVVPRVSVPLWARRYGGGRALPRYATTFELGATMGVYF